MTNQTFTDTATLMRASYHARLEADDTALAPFLTFRSRDSYLAWVAGWKAALSETVADIREARKQRADKTLTIETRGSAHERRQGLRVVGHNLMSLRRAGKIEASRQVQAERLVVVA